MKYKFFTFLNTRLNKILFFEDFIMGCLFIINIILGNNNGLYFLGIIDIIFIYILLLIKLYRRKDISIIEIFISFLFLYVIGTYIFFNSKDFQQLILKIFVSFVPKITNGELAILNAILFVYSKILMLPFYDIRFYFKHSKNDYNISSRYDVIIYICFFVFLPILIYGVKTYSDYTDALENSGPLFSLIAYFSFFLSILTILTDVKYYWNKNIFRTFLVILCAILIAKIGSRTYAMYLLFSLLINLKKRGLKFGNKVVFISIILFSFFILYQSIARIGMHGLESAFSVLVLFGEFFLPAYSFYYFVCNPLDLIYFFPSTDFIIKLLPSFILPELRIDAFMNYYSQHGVQVAPVGGMFFYGQLVYYWGFFSIVFLFFISLYFAYQKDKVEKSSFSMLSLFIPIVFLILPRQLLYLLPRTLLTIFVIYIFLNTLFYKGKRNKCREVV